MANDKTNVTVGKPKVGGAIHKGTASSTLPTNATDELDSTFTCLGYISEDGLNNDNGITSNGIKAWGGVTVMNTLEERTDTFGFTLIEALNPEVLKVAYGDDNVSGDLDSGIAVKVNSNEIEAAPYVVDMIMTGGVLKRIVIPSARPTSISEVTYDDTSAVGYNVTLTAEADSEDNTHYEYIQKKTTTTDTTGE